MSGVKWQADDKIQDAVLEIVNSVEAQYGEEHPTMASPIVEKGKQEIQNLIRKAKEFVEIFIPVRGYEGLYEVSNKGNVRSLPRKTTKGGILKPSLRGGYPFVTLGKKSVHIHRLVAENFLSNPENKLTVNHKDSNKINNNLDNLEWATYSENAAHGFRENGRVHPNTGDRKYDENYVIALRRLGMKFCDIARKTGIPYGSVCRYVRTNLETLTQEEK